MAGYGQFCPVARGAELFAERWTPLILRELLKDNHRFSELRRGLPRISKNLLVQRLASFERAGLLERRPATNGHGHEYHLPRERVVLRFEFRDRPRKRFWLVLDRPDVDLCYVDPGFAVDLRVSADVRAFTEVYLAHVSLDAALRAGTVQISGPQEYRTAFRTWLGVTPFARFTS